MAFPACGVDTTAFVSNGVYTKHYGLGEEQNLANLFSFYGFLEDAPSGQPPPVEKGFLVRFGLFLGYQK